MKVKNKKTGEIGEASISNFELVVRYEDGRVEKYPLLFDYSNLEYYEEPEEFWYINDCGNVIKYKYDGGCPSPILEAKEIGNYFETKEEAEKAVEKLKAFKRLKDKGFKFKDFTRKFDGFKRVDRRVFIVAELDDEGVIGMLDDLNICFGGEE